MKTIAICNHKGGVGKTAASMALAEGLNAKGYRTLLVDLDQQTNATRRLKVVDMIEAVLGFGSAKSEKLMKEIGIAKNRRLKGLGWKQAKELIDRLP